MKRLILIAILSWSTSVLAQTNNAYSKNTISNMFYTNNIAISNLIVSLTSNSVASISSYVIYTPTNVGSTSLIDFSKPVTLITTNDDVVITDVANWSLTNFNDTTYQITNTLASSKRLTVPLTFRPMDTNVNTALYFTNFAELRVFGTPYSGTNFYFNGR